MTSKTTFKKLPIADRNAVITGLNLSDDTAAKELGITVEEVATAREEVSPSANFDITPFRAHFQKPTTVSDGAAATVSRPVKKRGPRGTRITDAFDKVTGTPVPLAEFAKANHVSENCLSQPKRFYDRDDVQIRVRKIDGVRHIWSEAAVAPASATASTEA